MKKILYIISALILVIALVSCGSNSTTTSFSSPSAKVTASHVSPPTISSQAILAQAAKGSYKEGELLVRFKESTSQETIANVHQAIGSTVLRSFPNVTNLQLVTLPSGLTVQDAIGVYMADANVQYAEPNYLYPLSAVPNDLYFTPQQWALQNTGAYAYGTNGADISATGAWDISTGSRSVAVAVLDTGIDYAHPDLVGNIWADRVKVLLQDMHWLGHDTFKIVGEKVIYTDPYNIRAPLPTVPETDRADIILISHNHPDNCSPADVSKVKGPMTVVVTTVDCAETLRQDPTYPFIGQIYIVQPGSSLTVGGIDITAVPAYTTDTNDHPQANGWVGFVFRVNRNRDIAPPTDGPRPVVDLNQEPGPRIYFAGATDRIPEMAAAPIRGADVAILPVSGSDVMSADEAVLAAFDIRPKVVIPMHYGTIAGSAADAMKVADELEGKIEVAVMDDQRDGYTANTVLYDNNQKIDDWRGWNFVDDSNDPWDDNGHGTHVAGIIGATGNNGLGIAGVNWSVELMPLKVCDSSGMCSDDAIIGAIGYAVFKGVKILNASLGGPSMSYALRDTIVAAGQAGTMLIAAAGNGSSDNPMDGIGDNDDVSPVYPASYALDNIISVAATDQNDRRTSFSNFGLQTVHVAAPGQYILSTVPTNMSAFMTDWCTGTPFAGYNVCAGTSMAAPHVSGLAALLYNVYPTFTYSQIRGMIIKYVDILPTLDGWIYSGGRINAQLAVTALLKPAGLTASAQSPSQVSLSWQDDSGEDAYAIQRKQPDGSFVTVGVVGQNVTSFTDSGLSAGTSYTYRILAGSSLPNPPNLYPVPAESAYSDEVTVTTLGQAGSSASGGGGGGCSVGGTRTGYTNVADVFAMLAPLAVIFVIRGLRRRRK